MKTEIDPLLAALPPPQTRRSRIYRKESKDVFDCNRLPLTVVLLKIQSFTAYIAVVGYA